MEGSSLISQLSTLIAAVDGTVAPAILTLPVPAVVNKGTDFAFAEIRSTEMLPRFHHILVPLDFTEKNQAALDVAFELAVANQSRVTLLHVIEQIDLPGDEEVDEFTNQLQQRADKELELRGQRFAEANVPIDWKIRLGRRAVEISGYETEHGIDLIVLSSHPLNADDPARSLATFSYQVAVLSRCPVLLVK